jgi:hypothetical protein
LLKRKPLSLNGKKVTPMLDVEREREREREREGK